MSQPTTDRKIDADTLSQLLGRAQENADFRDLLLRSPETVFTQEGIQADKKWLSFFKRLTPENFAEEIDDKRVNDPTGEGEGTGEGSV